MYSVNRCLLSSVVHGLKSSERSLEISVILKLPSMYVHVCIHVYVLLTPGESVLSHRTGVTGDCEPPDVELGCKY